MKLTESTLNLISEMVSPVSVPPATCTSQPNAPRRWLSKLGYKDALNAIEVQSPGSKAAFYFTFIDRVSALFTPAAEEDRSGIHPCPGCDAPTTGELCAFCRLVAKAAR